MKLRAYPIPQSLLHSHSLSAILLGSFRDCFFCGWRDAQLFMLRSVYFYLVTDVSPRGREGGMRTERDKCQSRWNERTNDKLRRARASRSQFHFLYDAASSLRPSLTLIARVSRDCATEQSLDDACPQSEVRNSRLL